jgi:hypothetical protein
LLKSNFFVISALENPNAEFGFNDKPVAGALTMTSVKISVA